jgi:hypothetical protein
MWRVTNGGWRVSEWEHPAPTPLFFVSVASKGVAGENFVSVASKGVVSSLSATLMKGSASVDSKEVIDGFCL